MKTVLLNFWHILRRFKTASILNLLGLSSALVVFLICMMQVKSDLSFNHYFSKVDDIYMLSIYQNTNQGEFREFHVSTPNMATLRTNVAQLSNTECVQVHTNEYTMHQTSTDEYFSEDLMSVDKNFGKVFDIEIISGSLENVLADYNRLMISQTMAKKMFGDKDPIGSTIAIDFYQPKLEEGGAMTTEMLSINMTVEGIYKDFPKNTSIPNGLITLIDPPRFELYYKNNFSWNGSLRTYCLLKQPQEKQLLSSAFADKKVIDLLNIPAPQKGQEILDKANILEKRINLIPISNIQLNYPDESYSEQTYTRIFSIFAIGFVTLIIAYINFMNFITAMAPSRLRTINVQKIYGASRTSLALTVIFEAILLTLLSLVVALSVIFLISKSGLVSEFFDANISPLANISFILFITCLLIILASLVAIYPSIYLTAFKPVVSYGGASNNRLSKNMRNVLTTIQFTASILFIVIAIFMKIQHHYMQTFDMGVVKENVVYLYNQKPNGNWIIENPRSYVQEVLTSPQILDATLCDYELGTGSLGFMSNYNQFGERYWMRCIVADKRFIDFFGLNTTYNKDELQKTGKSTIDVYNKTFINSISEQYQEDLKASGILIIDDFNFDNLYKPIENLRITLNDEEPKRVIYFKLPREGFKDGVKILEAEWKKRTNEPFELKFLDKEIGSQYKAEENISILLTLFAIVIILIAIMGVYGLITFNTKNRAKEIAIRKVQGSTIQQIVLMLNQTILVQFIIGFVVSIPIAYYIVDKWLEQFVYKTPIHWWGYLLGGFIIFIITVLTVSWQSYRSATVNPIHALKDE